MFSGMRRLFSRGPAPPFRDSELGVFVSTGSGVWVGEVSLADGRVDVLLPGGRNGPDAGRLACARLIVSSLPSFVAAALDFGKAELPDLTLHPGALNLFNGNSPDSWALDFVAAGDNSGNCWQIDFEFGRPTSLTYT